MSKTKYIVALLAQDPTNFVRYAQRFAGIANGYLLSEHAHPHVTLVQFYGEDEDYQFVLAYLKSINITAPQPRFIGMTFGNDDAKDVMLWAGLTVARHPQLLHLHTTLVDLLAQRSITVINLNNDLYQPHLTLARIQGDVPECPRPTIPTVNFNLALGIADQLGQFTTVKHVFTDQLDVNSKPIIQL